MMLKLIAKFKTSEGKSQTWSYDNPDTMKTSEEVETLLERFSGLKLFRKEGVDLFDTVDSAKFVETIETVIF